MTECGELALVRLSGSSVCLADPEDDVRGLTVVDPPGHRIGSVEDVVIDEQERRSRLLVVSSGGILGLGASERIVTVEAVTKVDEQVHVDRHHTQVHDDPTRVSTGERAHDQLRDTDRSGVPPYIEVYGYYGLTPFWTAGYVVPYFHRRH